MIETLPENFQAILREISSYLGRYFVGIIGCSEPAIAEFIGSGTLIKVGETYGILTANHVAQALIQAYEALGLALIAERHSTFLSIEDIRVITVGTGGEGGFGPDLAVIVLPTDYVLSLWRALINRGFVKSFWSLSAENENILNILKHEDHNSKGVFCLGGYFGEWVIEESINGKYTLDIKGICGFGAIENYKSDKEHDYFNIGIDRYSSEGLPLLDIPADLSGLSGGGVWFVPYKYKDGIIDTAAMLVTGILVGVAFSQGFSGTPQEAENANYIPNKEKCHGWKSVYKRVRSKLR